MQPKASNFASQGDTVLVARVRSHFRANNPRYADPLEIYAEHRDLIDTFRRGGPEASAKALEKHATGKISAPLLLSRENES